MTVFIIEPAYAYGDVYGVQSVFDNREQAEQELSDGPLKALAHRLTIKEYEVRSISKTSTVSK